MAFMASSSSHGDSSPRVTSASHSPRATSASDSPRATSASQSPRTRSEEREEMISGIPKECQYEFVSISKTRQILKAAAEKLRKMESSQQFVLFRNFKKPLAALNQIEGRRSYRYSHFDDIIIVKFMPGNKHERAAEEFGFIIFNKVRNVMGLPSTSLVANGSARIPFSDGQGSKEPDKSFVPEGRTGADNGIPSLVIEVGVSESLAQLRNDAWRWLTKTRGLTKFVILLSIDVPRREIYVETHNLQPGNNPPLALAARPTRSNQRTVESIDLKIYLRDEQVELQHQRSLNIPLGICLGPSSWWKSCNSDHYYQC